jgi:hypothetical protein
LLGDRRKPGEPSYMLRAHRRATWVG